jgi:hypothetical protein
MSHGTEDKAICAGDRLIKHRFSARNPLSCPQPSRGNMPDPNLYGGPLGRRCCTFLLYCLFELFEFVF